MPQRRRRRPAFHAEPAFVDREFPVAGDVDTIALAGQIHAALKRAVRAMRRHGDRRGLHPVHRQEQGPCPAMHGVIAPRVAVRQFRNVHECRSQEYTSTNTHTNHAAIDTTRCLMPVAGRRFSKIKSTQSRRLQHAYEHFRLISSELSAFCPLPSSLAFFSDFLQKRAWHSCCSTRRA